MPRSRRRRSAYSSRRTASNGGATALILLAAVLVVAGMGVAIQSKKRAHAEPTRVPVPPPAAKVVAREPVVSAPVATAPASLVQAVTRTVKDAEQTTRGLRGATRDRQFTRLQTDTMAALSNARERLGAWLDEHPDDVRANKLWDRLQRVYITLKKL